jgi:hypothetical protein
VCSSISNFFSEIKNGFQTIWSDKKQRLILIGVFTSIIIIIIILIIISAISSSNNYETYSGEKYEKPDCTDVCSKPYDIQVYTDGILKAKLKD